MSVILKNLIALLSIMSSLHNCINSSVKLLPYLLPSCFEWSTFKNTSNVGFLPWAVTIPLPENHTCVFSGFPEALLHNFRCHAVDFACHWYYVRSVFLSSRYVVFGPHIRNSCVQYLRRGACCKQFRIRRSIVGHPTLMLEDHLCSSQQGTFAVCLFFFKCFFFAKVLSMLWSNIFPVTVIQSYLFFNNALKC